MKQGPEGATRHAFAASSFQGFPDSILNCRGCDSSQTVHPECWPIPVPNNDPYFPATNTSSGHAHCIAFTRSLPGQQRLGEEY